MPKIRESKTARRERAGQILAILESTYPESRIALDYETPFQLLVATILAAQCTDARVNTVTPALFERYPSPQAFIDAPQEELEEAVHPTGFFRNKAKAIKAASTAIMLEFGGEVPGTMEQLISIPGIGRKSANVILGHCFDVPGMVVDTHVKRIANLLGFVDTEDPEKIEHALEPLFPPEKWTRLGHLFQDHGRAICVARRPKCDICPIAPLCPSAGISTDAPETRIGGGKKRDK
jgi:endonuclease III